MAVANNTQYSQSWQTIYNLFTDSTKGLSDPQTRGLDKDDWIFSGFPDIKGDGFPGYPIVALVSPDISTARLTISERINTIMFRLELVTNNLADLDTLADDILHTIFSNTDTTEAANMMSPKIINSTSTTIFLDGKKKLHQKNLFLRYKWKGEF